VTYTDLDEFMDGDLQIPAKGRIWRVKQPTAREGLRLARLMTNPGTKLDDAAELAEIKKILGENWHDMGQRLTHTERVHAGRAALIHYGIGAKLAETYWEGGTLDLGNPHPPKPTWRWLRGKKT
jgi:hypothetical protein